MEMSSILHPLGSHLTHIEAQIEFWHNERLKVPTARRSPRASFSLIEASSEISVNLFKGCIWACYRVLRCRLLSDLFLNNCAGILWVVKGCRTSQPLPIHIREGSIRASNPNATAATRISREPRQSLLQMGLPLFSCLHAFLLCVKQIAKTSIHHIS